MHFFSPGIWWYFCFSLYLSLAILIIREEITSSCGTIDNCSLAGAYLHHAALVTPAFPFTVFLTHTVPVKHTLFTHGKVSRKWKTSQRECDSQMRWAEEGFWEKYIYSEYWYCSSMKYTDLLSHSSQTTVCDNHTLFTAMVSTHLVPCLCEGKVKLHVRICKMKKIWRNMSSSYTTHSGVP